MSSTLGFSENKWERIQDYQINFYENYLKFQPTFGSDVLSTKIRCSVWLHCFLNFAVFSYNSVSHTNIDLYVILQNIYKYNKLLKGGRAINCFNLSLENHVEWTKFLNKIQNFATFSPNLKPYQYANTFIKPSVLLILSYSCPFKRFFIQNSSISWVLIYFWQLNISKTLFSRQRLRYKRLSSNGGRVKSSKFVILFILKKAFETNHFL